jgi:membrane-associated phospholipid phosphatase
MPLIRTAGERICHRKAQATHSRRVHWLSTSAHTVARLCCILSALLPLPAVAQTIPDTDGPFEIDHRLSPHQDGIFSRNTQKALYWGLAAGIGSYALVEGSESRSGLTAWRSLDAMVITAIATHAAKVTFSRTRPAQTENADNFFQHGSNRSFPSGEVSHVAAVLTPFVLEYGTEYPWVAVTSAALLFYDAEARMKSRAHWQSDVIAGAALGVGVGYLMHERQQPLLLLPLNGGVFFGLRKQF